MLACIYCISLVVRLHQRTDEEALDLAMAFYEEQKWAIAGDYTQGVEENICSGRYSIQEALVLISS